MFTRIDALILLAISSADSGCPIPDIYWHVDFLDRAVPTADEIRTAVEKGFASGLLGYSKERFVVSPASRAKMLALAHAAGSVNAPDAVAAWLNQEFAVSSRAIGFELKEQRDDGFRYGIASVEWRVFDESTELSDVAYAK